jgi:RNA polymerase sigma-70 factor (ECF subfamily)
VLIVCDVLDWSAVEAAEALEMTVSAVNSALHRARETLAASQMAGEASRGRTPPPAQVARATVEQYVRAIQNADVGGLVTLLKEAATFTMPPIPTWFRGRAAVTGFMAQALLSEEARGRWRFVPAGANGQPAFGLYQLDSAREVYQAFALQVLTLDPSGTQIAEITNFTEPRLFGRFNLPSELPRTPAPPP